MINKMLGAIVVPGSGVNAKREHACQMGKTE
jgi:hypothetical protein